MSVKVYVNPTYTRTDVGDGGIRRVSEAQITHLPHFDIECVGRAIDADVIINHGASLVSVPGVPELGVCHGLYWSKYPWDRWAHETNAQVVEVLARAKLHTAPSEWVSRAMRRGMLIYPEVVYHGIDCGEWKPPTTKHGNYVLWNKARLDWVSDAGDMQRLAELLPRTKFVSTIGTAQPNVRITGIMPVSDMYSVVQSAGVYLATARETFGIGTLEALACGVPVVGWDWGGQSEIVVHGETGYLAEPGNYADLAECVARCFKERKRLSTNARNDAATRWQWLPRIEQYARLVHALYRQATTPHPKVSIIVPCHNLGKYLGDALQSAFDQSMTNFECVVVDDDSSDNTAYIAMGWASRDARFKYVKTPTNLKLPATLNYGYSQTTGDYILSLDADNLLDPNALKVLCDALDTRPDLHIVYGHLDMISDDGSNKRRSGGWPFAQFDYVGQLAHLNQITSTALMRREVWERSGGYRVRQWRAEDAEFWSRVTSFGFRATKVTELSTLIYRERADSKSKSEPGDGNWLAWLPWAVAGADTPQNGVKALRRGLRTHQDKTPWGAQGRPTNSTQHFWPVPDCVKPKVSVVIPCGPKHEQYLLDALDSVQAQTFTSWEAIVVFDDGRVIASPNINGAPYAITATTGGQYGPGVARNLGAKLAQGELLYFLDADDYLLPYTLEKMVDAYTNTGRLVYGDWLRNDADGTELRLYMAFDFECKSSIGDLVDDPWNPGTLIPRGVLGQMAHSVNALVPKAWHDRIGGFDEAMPGWEDWDYFIALQDAGLCSVRIPEPLFVYRFRAGTRRESSFGDRAALNKYIRGKWSKYYLEGEVLMCGCNSNDSETPDTFTPAAPRLGSEFNGSQAEQIAYELALIEQAGDPVWVEFGGAHVDPLTYRGVHSGTPYRFGTNDDYKQKLVTREDARDFIARLKSGVRQFRLVVNALVKAPTPVSAGDFTQMVVSSETARPLGQELPTMALEDDMGLRPLGAPVTRLAPVVAPAMVAVEDTALYPDVLTLTVKDVRAMLPIAKVPMLTHWLRVERASENPRKVVVADITRALDKLGQREPV